MRDLIDIQPSLTGRYDVLVNGDHYATADTRDAAYATAREAAGKAPRYALTIRDFTTMGEHRTAAGVPFAIVPRKEAQA